MYPLDHQVRDFSQIFGTARDWDVFIGQTLQTTLDSGWVGLVRDAARGKQAAAHAAVRQALEGSVFNSLLLSLMDWVERDQGMLVARRLQRPARDLVPALLDRLADRVDHHRLALTDDDSSLHELRKSAKRLRYAVEFIADLFPAKQVKQMLKPCKEAQEILGSKNDLATARQMLHALANEQPALAPAIGDLLGWLADHATKPKVTQAIRQLKSANRFWQ